jgi:uncharacterized protein
MSYYIDWTKEPDTTQLRNAYNLLESHFDQGRRILEKLAENGSVASMFYLGDAYASGRFGSKNLLEAKKWYERAESKEWIPASYRLGRIYFSLGDYASALQAFSRGADKGYPPAIYRLGMMYIEGRGVSRNLDEGRRFLTAAIADGHLFAKRDLAGLYIRGKCGRLNIPKGLVMMLSLILEMAAITVRRGWRDQRFEDRISA